MKKYVIVEAPKGKESTIGKTLEIDIPKTSYRLELYMSAELHTLFKAQCALEGKKMTELMITLIKDYVKQN